MPISGGIEQKRGAWVRMIHKKNKQMKTVPQRNLFFFGCVQQPPQCSAFNSLEFSGGGYLASRPRRWSGSWFPW
jgi:hypothetical protein